MSIHISPIEVKLFTQAIFEQYGYDFSEYSPDSFKRRLVNILEKHNLKNLCACLYKVINDRDFFYIILNDLTITVTEMFRDPYSYIALRNIVIPYLKTYPKFKIWHAGCATGEEVYSFAILLKESGLVNRSIIYATDINQQALAFAKKGFIKKNGLQNGIKNYFAADGETTLSSYISYHETYPTIEDLNKENIVFAEHNLVSDHSFGEMQLIFCRNVLIYFSKPLQERVLKLITNSLCSGGYLCLGSKESLDFSSIHKSYELIDSKSNIYRKKQ